MSVDMAVGTETTSDTPPTTPFTVVWSRGHAYVLEDAPGRARWVGVDDRGRPLTLTNAQLQRRGWSRTSS
ncbi:hypothetical protein [Actinoalloteichus spitiensis]|uniref:hypothetical protein n=1 Tax=Actinoalloteichus spitiensis TaxID=252394 RepID=UPI00037E6A77|nr:hypothetical protein [Actinoalloteichus spitiensis]